MSGCFSLKQCLASGACSRNPEKIMLEIRSRGTWESQNRTRSLLLAARRRRCARVPGTAFSRMPSSDSSYLLPDGTRRVFASRFVCRANFLFASASRRPLVYCTVLILYLCPLGANRVPSVPMALCCWISTKRREVKRQRQLAATSVYWQLYSINCL